MFYLAAFINGCAIHGQLLYEQSLSAFPVALKTGPQQPQLKRHKMFDANDFINSSNETVLDDKFNQLDPAVYKAVVGVGDKDLEIATGEKDGTPWARMIVKFEIIDISGEIEAKLGRKPTIRYDFFLDLDDNGKLDQSRQKNVKLGALLKATGCAKSGWKPTDIKGKQLTLTIAKVKNDLNPSEPRSQVVQLGVAA